MISDPKDSPLQLVPESAWSKLADDDKRAIWLTTATIVEIARYEPTCRLADCSSETLLDVLRQADHAAFVIVDKHKHNVVIECRARSGERLYVFRQGDIVKVSAGIEHVSAVLRALPLSRRFLAIWLANALNFGGFDLFLGSSPFENCHLIARGLRLQLSLNTEDSEIKTVGAASDGDLGKTKSLTDAISACRLALTESISIATRELQVIAECSGGIDSGLTAVLASRLTGKRFRGAVFADYPFHEFKQERDYSQAIARRENFNVLNTDYKLWIRWGGLGNEHQREVSLEPSLHIPYWGQAVAGIKNVASGEPAAILTGQGGDNLFQTRTLAPYFPAKPVWLPRAYWDMISEETENIRMLTESPALSSCGYGYDNPWMTRALGKIYAGTIYNSPLATRATIVSFNNLRCYLDPMLSDNSALDNIQKPLAYSVFSDLLPESVWARRWKVNYVGLYYRSWFNAGDSLIGLVRRKAVFLDLLGLSSSQFVDGVTEMAQGKKSSDRLMNALVTYLFWLDCFFTKDELHAD